MLSEPNPPPAHCCRMMRMQAARLVSIPGNHWAMTRRQGGGDLQACRRQAPNFEPAFNKIE